MFDKRFVRETRLNLAAMVLKQQAKAAVDTERANNQINKTIHEVLAAVNNLDVDTQCCLAVPPKLTSAFASSDRLMSVQASFVALSYLPIHCYIFSLLRFLSGAGTRQTKLPLSRSVAELR